MIKYSTCISNCSNTQAIDIVVKSESTCNCYRQTKSKHHLYLGIDPICQSMFYIRTLYIQRKTTYWQIIETGIPKITPKVNVPHILWSVQWSCLRLLCFINKIKCCNVWLIAVVETSVPIVTRICSSHFFTDNVLWTRGGCYLSAGDA